MTEPTLKYGYYVMQTAPAKETVTIAVLKAAVGDLHEADYFSPVVQHRKKIRGKWTDIYRRLIPGYVFIRICTGSVLDYYENIKSVPELTKLLGKHGDKNDIFTRLSAKEENWLETLLKGSGRGKGNKGDTEEPKSIGLSQVRIDDKDHISIISVPLKGLEGQIRRINLHRRIAEVEVPFMNTTALIHIGIEICTS